MRDPNKQHRFVEAELQALLQAAGGTLPIIKKDAERGVYVLVETAVGDHGHAAKPAPAKAAAPAPAAKAAAPAAPKPTAPKPAGHKLGENPNRQLFRRSTYAGVKDTGPVPGETFEQKVARLKAVSAAAKQRAEETGEPSPVGEAPEILTDLAPDQEVPPPAAPVASSPAPAHKPTGNADRTLFKRSTYCGVVDTGPVPGETFQQKVARLTALSAAAKQRSEGG